MKLNFFGSCPKDLSASDSNEDKFSFSIDQGRYALCDGASESYNSKLWAQILANKFVNDPKISPAWVDAAVIDYELQNAPASLLSWSKQAAYERGSFSTLLGIEYDSEHNTIDILAIGDSLAILVDIGAVTNTVASWPFSDPERFKEHPTLLSTLRTHNSFIGDAGFWTNSGKTFYLDGLSQPVLLCMTDALGEWALKESLSAGVGLSTLITMSSIDQLNSFVVEERASNRMRIDDSTLLIFSFE
jgi:hypothetical protein